MIMLSQKVVKINRKNKKQRRILLITNMNVLNIKLSGWLFTSHKIKRKISLG